LDDQPSIVKWLLQDPLLHLKVTLFCRHVPALFDLSVVYLTVIALPLTQCHG
jgi:hypothetical protein